MNAPSYVADPAGNNPLPSLKPDGPSVNPKEHVEPGTSTSVVLGFFLFGLGILIGGAVTYGILWAVLIIAPIAHYFNRKKAIAALKGSAVEVSEAQLPEIHQCAVTIAGRLGMSSAPKIYVLEANTINAAAVKLAGKKVVVLQDDMVDACLRSGDARTLTFIIGHEMAHHALGHTGIFRSGLSKAFKKLSRLDEFSCDAVANAVVADQKISARAITLLTVGPQLMSFVNSDSLMRQAQEVNLDKYSKKAEPSPDTPVAFAPLKSVRFLTLKGMWRLLPLQTSRLHFPPLQIPSQFAGPVFLGAGHEYLPAGFPRLVQQGQETAAAFYIQFSHDIINQQDRCASVDAGEIFRLRHLQGDGQRTFLAFTAKLCSGLFIKQQLQIIAMRPNERGAECSFPAA